MTKWLKNNKHWLFDGIGTSVVVVIMGLVINSPWPHAAAAILNAPVWLAVVLTFIVLALLFVFARWGYTSQPQKLVLQDSRTDNLENRKRLVNILFIDDQTNFKVVSILRNAGWRNAKIKRDIRSLDEQDVREAHICFVDVNGVGKLLNFKDEGLGLAVAIKEKYSDKKIVIYSAHSEGDRFHEALRKVDATLRKNADPYEFQNLVEEFSAQVKLT